MKRSAGKGRFEMSSHVFLSHSTVDKPAVEELARRLRDKEGIQAWAGQVESDTRSPWQPAIEEPLQESESCAAFVGRDGFLAKVSAL